MSSDLVEIQPTVLKFTFEVRKQTQCSIQLTNKTENFVGFKVKTTSPKKYVVKPNIGVIKAKGVAEFTVIMLAQSVAPPDLLCKDKFLIQSTIVPFGLTEENITSEMFVKDSSKHIEDKKLKVVLVPPTSSTAESPESMPSNDVPKQDLHSDASLPKDEASAEAEKHPPHKDVEGSQIAQATEEIRFTRDAESRPSENTDELSVARTVETNEVQKPRSAEDTVGLRIAESVESSEIQKVDEHKVLSAALDLKLRKEAEELTLKIKELGSKLAMAEQTAAHLTEEKHGILHEKEIIEQELNLARRKNVVKKIYKGYPLLYVFMVAMFSLTFGYLMRQ